MSEFYTPGKHEYYASDRNEGDASELNQSGNWEEVLNATYGDVDPKSEADQEFDQLKDRLKVLRQQGGKTGCIESEELTTWMYIEHPEEAESHEPDLEDQVMDGDLDPEYAARLQLEYNQPKPKEQFVWMFHVAQENRVEMAVMQVEYDPVDPDEITRPKTARFRGEVDKNGRLRPENYRQLKQDLRACRGNIAEYNRRLARLHDPNSEEAQNIMESLHELHEVHESLQNQHSQKVDVYPRTDMDNEEVRHTLDMAESIRYVDNLPEYLDRILENHGF